MTSNAASQSRSAVVPETLQCGGLLRRQADLRAAILEKGTSEWMKLKPRRAFHQIPMIAVAHT